MLEFGLQFVASVKVATLTDATWGAVSEYSGGFGMFWRFRNVLAVSECSGGFRTFWWFQNFLLVSELSGGSM